MPSSRKTAATNAGMTSPSTMRLLNLSQFEVLTIIVPPHSSVSKARSRTGDNIPIGVGIIISSIVIGWSIISSIVIWISIVSTSVGSTINPANVPTVGSIIVLCIVWLSLCGLRQITQPG